jgi:hypothetical protein
VNKLLYPRLPDQARYKNTGTEIAVNLGFAYSLASFGVTF